MAHKLVTIGEAAGRLPVEFRERHADIPWSRIVAFRNILVHAYFGIQWKIVRETASEEVPVLRIQVANIQGSG